jgi:hypothetical protein
VRGLDGDPFVRLARVVLGVLREERIMNSHFVSLRATVGQTLGVFAAVLNAVSMGVSGLEGPLE